MSCPGRCDHRRRGAGGKGGQLLMRRARATTYYDINAEKVVAYEYVITAYDDDEAVLAVMTAATG